MLWRLREYGWGFSGPCRVSYIEGLNNHHYHVEVYSKYPALSLHTESGTVILVIVEAATISFRVYRT